MEELNSQNYINKNCWLVKSLGRPASKRCRYCTLRFRNCPIVQYFSIALILSAVALGILVVTGEEVSKPVLLAILLVVLGCGYLSNRLTTELIKANFLEKKAREELKDQRAVLEIRVRARTKELEELTKTLEDQVKERTKELQERVNELERFHQLTIGREKKMIELKKKLKRLESELEKEKSKKS
jgi:C4-dicarboxylate-specific signal transduction histidine kinase